MQASHEEIYVSTDCSFPVQNRRKGSTSSPTVPPSSASGRSRSRPRERSAGRSSSSQGGGDGVSEEATPSKKKRKTTDESLPVGLVLNALSVDTGEEAVLAALERDVGPLRRSSKVSDAAR